MKELNSPFGQEPHSKNTQDVSRTGRLYGKAIDVYFRPKKIERNPRFYPRLGVRVHRDYMPYPTLGLRKKFKFDKLIKEDIPSSLTSAEKNTRLMEAAHVLISVPISGTIACGLLADNLKIAVVAAGVNVVVNVYPIMLQRYNRARIYNIWDRQQRRKDNNSA